MAADRRVAVVTGAARGIGRAIAVRLAQAGFHLVLIDGPSARLRDAVSYPLGTAEELSATADACRSLGVDTQAVVADVLDEDEIAAAVSRIPATQLRAAVAVAGIMGPDKPAWELSRTELDIDMDVNFHGVANLARATVPLLMVAPPRTGRFVAVVSTAGETGLPRLAGYVASKHAALGYLRSLAADLGPAGVTVNAVLPGSTRTAILQRSAEVYGLANVDAFAIHQRLGRLIEPDEIAAAVSWLCGPESSGMTGSAVRVDGGFVG